MNAYRGYGILVGVDDSILKLSFGNHTQINYWDHDQGLQQIARLSHLDLSHLSSQQLLVPWINRNNDKIYYLTVEMDENELISKYGQTWTIKWREEFKKYIYNKILTLKIIKKSCIQISNWFYCEIDGSSEKPVGGSNFIEYLPSSEFVLYVHPTEVEIIQNCLNQDLSNTQFSNVNLAILLYDYSWHKFDYRRGFLEAMMGMEALFNPSSGEISNRISRSVAIFIGGGDVTKARIVYENMRDYYDKRSGMVHGNRNVKNSIELTDLQQVREYLRICILKYIKLNKDKDELLKFINELGFDTQCIPPLDI